MATWNIDPSGGLASIDNTGKLTYQEHTEDKTYTISYADGTCTASKEITITGCNPGHFKKKLGIYMAINGYSIATFILRIQIRHDGETLPVYENYLGERYRECGEAESYRDDIDIDVMLEDDFSAYTFYISVENCHGWTSDCVDDTSSYTYMINGQPSSTGGESIKLSEIPPSWQYGFIAIPSH